MSLGEPGPAPGGQGIGAFTLIVILLIVGVCVWLVYRGEQVVYIAPDPPQLQMHHIEEP